MGALREQMERQMVLRRMSVRTRQSYSAAVAQLAKHYRRQPDRLTAAEIQSYLLYLIEERKLASSSCNVALHGLRFFYHETLKRSDMQFAIPRARAPQRLPDILSREEIERLFTAASLLKHRVLLMTTYAAGLRVSEVCALKVTDIDSERMTIRVEQGKGAKDRYTLLSPRLLKELRRCNRSIESDGGLCHPSGNTKFTDRTLSCFTPTAPLPPRIASAKMLPNGGHCLT